MSVTTPPAPPAPVTPARRVRAARSPRAPLTGSAALARWVLAALGALAMWGLLYPFLLGAALEKDAQQSLFDELRAQLSQATAPVGPTGFGRPVALLDAPSIGLRSAVVVEGTTAQDLQSGPGHLRSSVLPGQVGTSVVLGKAATFGAPFGKLPGLAAGDSVTVTTGQGTFTYVVERVRRPGDTLPTPLALGGSRMVLVTAEGPGWRSGFAPSSVVYVDTTLKGGKPALSPGGRPTATPAERPNGRSPEPLLALVFWLQGLLLAALAAVWLRARWGRWQTAAVAVPLLSALAVGASTAAAGLLPNLL